MWRLSGLTNVFKHHTADDVGRPEADLLNGDDQEFLRIRLGRLNAPGTSRNRLDGYEKRAKRVPLGALPFD